MYELGVEGGTVVMPKGRRRANIYVSSGRVAEVTPERRRAKQRIDAFGLLVMPGMVDAHVHFMDPSAMDREDFVAGSAAAAHAGVTTVIEHSHSGPVRTSAEFHEKVDYLNGRSQVDFALGAHAWPGMVGEVGPLWAAGAAFFKAFTCSTHGIPAHNPADLLNLLRSAATYGATCLMHCEEESLTRAGELALRQTNRQDGGVIPGWRSREAELVAIAVTAQLARLTGARVVVAHASHPAAVDSARLACTVETCPQYLTLFENEAAEYGPLRKFTPPARARSESELTAMWNALAAGHIDYISSDHAPSTIAQKQAGSIWDVHFGLPGIDTTFPLLIDAVYRGRLTFERVVSAYAESPARVYGLYPRKGSLEPGSDADIVLVDPNRRWVVSNDDIVSKAGWSPYAGRTLIGGAVTTLLRGKQAEPGAGVFVPGPGVVTTTSHS
jgi:dihydroorotase